MKNKDYQVCCVFQSLFFLCVCSCVLFLFFSGEPGSPGDLNYFVNCSGSLATPDWCILALPDCSCGLRRLINTLSAGGVQAASASPMMCTRYRIKLCCVVLYSIGLNGTVSCCIVPCWNSTGYCIVLYATRYCVFSLGFYFLADLWPLDGLKARQHPPWNMVQNLRESLK